MLTEKRDRGEAADRALAAQSRADVRAWIRKARALFAELPPGTSIFWQEQDCNLLIRGPEGETYMDGDGMERAAVIERIKVHGSASGAW